MGDRKGFHGLSSDDIDNTYRLEQILPSDAESLLQVLAYYGKPVCRHTQGSAVITWLRCVCPQNNPDTNPSFAVYHETQSSPAHFHCYACGQHGRIIDLVRLLENKDLSKHQVYQICKRIGIRFANKARDDVHHRPDAVAYYQGDNEVGAHVLRQRLSLDEERVRLMREVVAHYHITLMTSRNAAPALHYLLAQRGISPHTLYTHLVGYADGKTLIPKLQNCGLLKKAEETGVVKRTKQGELREAMAHRVVVPVFWQNDPVFLIGRVLPTATVAQARDRHIITYLGLSSEHWVKMPLKAHHEHPSAPLHGTVLVEGPFDLLALHSRGWGAYFDIIASMGQLNPRTICFALQEQHIHPPLLIWPDKDKDFGGLRIAMGVVHTLSQMGVPPEHLHILWADNVLPELSDAAQQALVDALHKQGRFHLLSVSPPSGAKDPDELARTGVSPYHWASALNIPTFNAQEPPLRRAHGVSPLV